MKRDLVISPFGGDSRAILDAAVRAEAEGFDGVWLFDHVTSLASSTAPGVGASRDPFVLLGAIAARTSRVRLGTLVANIYNRHPAQLALAMDSLAGLAAGRVVVGLGSGAGARSAFSGENEALRREAAPASSRRADLAEYVEALRALWRGEDVVGTHATTGLTGVVVGPAPRLVVGGGAPAMLELAARVADGVNINAGLRPELATTVAAVRAIADERDLPGGFEVSVFVAAPVASVDLADVPDGVDRVTFLVKP